MPKDLIAKWSKFVEYCSNSPAIVAELGNYAALKDNPELQRLYLKVAQDALMATPYIALTCHLNHHLTFCNSYGSLAFTLQKHLSYKYATISIIFGAQLTMNLV